MKKDERLIGKCLECRHSKCMRRFPRNPIIAICRITGERHVANKIKICEQYDYRNSPFKLFEWEDAQ